MVVIYSFVFAAVILDLLLSSYNIIFVSLRLHIISFHSANSGHIFSGSFYIHQYFIFSLFGLLAQNYYNSAILLQNLHTEAQIYSMIREINQNRLMLAFSCWFKKKLISPAISSIVQLSLHLLKICMLLYQNCAW